MSYIGKTPTPAPLTSSDITDSIISLPKLTDGTDGNLISYDASGNPVAVATGSNGQVLTSAGAGAVPSFQAVSSYDDNKLVNDISTLALHQATNNNSAKYNLTNSNVDVYQDSSAIANLVNCNRNTTGEYISTISSSIQNANSYSVGGGNIGSDNNLTHAQDGVSNTRFAYTTGSSVSGYATFDYGASYTWEQMDIGKYRGHGDGRSILITYSADNSSYSNVNFTNASSTAVSYVGSNPNLSNFTSSGTADWGALTSNSNAVICRVTGFTPFAARYLRYKFGSADFHDANAGFSQFKWTKVVASATGNYQSTAQTANASVNKISGVVTYTNASGTATLNTDIILQVSADNGSNYTNATLTAAGTFSSGVLQAVTNDVSVTAGTQLKYKILFANQSSGSKVTRINGVSLSY